MTESEVKVMNVFDIYIYNFHLYLIKELTSKVNKTQINLACWCNVGKSLLRLSETRPQLPGRSDTWFSNFDCG